MIIRELAYTCNEWIKFAVHMGGMVYYENLEEKKHNENEGNCKAGFNL